MASVTGPTPWKRPIGRAATKSGPIAGVITNNASGFRWSEATLAKNLLYETPAEATRPVRSRISARIAFATAVAVGCPKKFSVTSR